MSSFLIEKAIGTVAGTIPARLVLLYEANESGGLVREMMQWLEKERKKTRHKGNWGIKLEWLHSRLRLPNGGPRAGLSAFLL